MKKINEILDGDQIRGIYFCREKQLKDARNGKQYYNLTLQDNTGTINGKIWDVDSAGIADFDEKDYIDVRGSVTTFNSELQLRIDQLRVAAAGEYDPADYLPSTDGNVEAMFAELLKYGDTVEAPYYRRLIDHFFREDQAMIDIFKGHSAAKTIHHGFAGGLLEHTLGVTRLCGFYLNAYPWLQRDLLITAALLHDIGKTRELAPMPDNDYTDAGQLLGHIVIGVEMLDEAIREIPDFPEIKANELKHCIVAHHGELEFGSPKKPALAEALALNYADLTDAKLETAKEILKNAGDDWLGYNRLFETNMRRTSKGE